MFSFTRRAFDHVNEGGGAASPMPYARRPKIGLALSSGVARGWSHIGVVTLNPERDAAVSMSVCASHTQQKAA